MNLDRVAQQAAHSAGQRLGTRVPVIPKVVVYMTDAGCTELLAFTQPLTPQAGLQVPAGTIEPGEDPATACAREFHEETGYQLPATPFLLSRTVFDATAYKPEVHIRNWFWCLASPGLPATGWDHTEPRHGVGPLLHRFAWLPLAAASCLEAGFCDMVPALRSFEAVPPTATSSVE